MLVKNLRLVMTLEVPEFAADTWDGESWWGIYTVKQKWLSGDSTFPGVAQFRIAAGYSGKTMGAGSIVDTAVQKCPSQQGHSKARFVLLFG